MGLNRTPPIVPPASLDPRGGSLSGQDFLVARRLGFRGRVRFQTRCACTIDEVMTNDALIILSARKDRAWIRRAAVLRSAPPQAAVDRLVELNASNVVLQSVLGTQGGRVPADSLAPVRIEDSAGRYRFDRDVTYVPKSIFYPIGGGWAARFFVTVPHGPFGKITVINSDACQVDDLPSFAHAYAVADTKGPRSYVRYQGKLVGCARAHALWVSMMLQLHSIQMEGMLMRRAGRSDGGTRLA